MDITWIIIGITILAVLDTFIGNRLFPGKVKIVKSNNYYYVCKTHRFLLFIWLPLWLANDNEDRVILAFHILFNNADAHSNINRAIRIAKLYSGQIKNNNRVIWSSNSKELNEKLKELRESDDEINREMADTIAQNTLK